MKLSANLFDHFEKRCHYWKEVLGITDVHLHIESAKLDDANAAVYLDKDAGLMSIFIGDPIDKRVAHRDHLDRMAFHEVFEGGWLYSLQMLAGYGYTRERVNEVAHRTVRMAESTIFEYLKGYK